MSHSPRFIPSWERDLTVERRSSARQGTSRPLATWLGSSLLIHGSLAGAWLRDDPSKPAPLAKDEPLIIEIAGLQSDQQTDERRAGDTPKSAVVPSRLAPEAPRAPSASSQPDHTRASTDLPKQPQPPAPNVARAPPASSETERVPVPEAAPPQQSAAREPEPRPSEPNATTPIAPRSPSAGAAEPAPTAKGDPKPVGTDDRNQDQRTLQNAARSQADLMRRYLARLQKAITARLVYPEQARAARYVGAPVIRFTITPAGDILPGSLSVQQSSGYPALDDKALRAARDSVPLPPPPRQMTVALDIGFEREPL